MVKSMTTFKESFRAEMDAQKAEKLRRKEERQKRKEERGPLGPIIATQAKNFGIGVVYTVIYLSFVYCVVMFSTLYLPDIFNIVLGYFNPETSLMMSVEFAGLFFTAWLFVASFTIVKMVTKLYSKAMKSLFHSDK